MSKTSKPHVKAAEIEKQAVRALSEKEIDDALTASTYGGTDAKRVKDLEKDIEVLRAECLDLKKTISKMKDAHAEEIHALEDELMEARALGKKAGEYAHTLDEDSDAFEEILTLTGIIHASAVQMQRASGLIKAKTEGRV